MKQARLIGGFALLLAFLMLLLFQIWQKEYEVRGTILGFSIGEDAVIIDHGEIAGYMPSMIMPFYNSKEVFKDFVVGDSISFTLVVRGGNAWPQKPESLGKSKRRDISVSPIPEDILGSNIPSLRLVDQDNRPFSLTDLQGEDLLVSFIYTRCPIPNFCPLMSQNFAEIAAEKLTNLNLLSISIDPEYDRPEILKSYSSRYSEEIDNWTFATGDKEEIDRFASRFGIQYAREGDDMELIHNLVTMHVTDSGVIRRIWRGNRWMPQEVIDHINRERGDLSH